MIFKSGVGGWEGGRYVRMDFWIQNEGRGGGGIQRNEIQVMLGGESMKLQSPWMRLL